MNAETAFKIYRQIKDKNLYGEDLEPFLEALKYFTDNSEYAEEELYGWEKIVQVNLRDAKNFYLYTHDPFAEHPKLDIKYGNADSPDTIISSDVDTFTGIICGRTQRFVEGPRIFRVEGDNSQAGIFFMLLMLIAQEFTEQKRQGIIK